MRPNRKEPVLALFWFQSLKFARQAELQVDTRHLLDVFTFRSIPNDA